MGGHYDTSSTGKQTGRSWRPRLLATRESTTSGQWRV